MLVTVHQEVCKQLFVSSACVFKAYRVPHLVHGVLGDDLECPQGNPQVHERDRYRPQGDDCQDAHKWVDPYGSSCNAQLKHGHTHTHTGDRKLAKSRRTILGEGEQNT